MKKILLTIILTSFVFTQTDGEVVKNVVASQRTDGSKILDIYYDLEQSDLYTSYDVYVKIEYPDVDHAFYLSHCSGDVWNNVLPGNNKYIECQLAATFDVESQNLSGEFYVNVHADANAVSELPDSFVFETISINTEFYPTALIENDYELMKYEVTAIQYIEFLNTLLATAVNIDNHDEDAWIDQEGGETFDRTYTFQDGNTIRIYYTNVGGDYQGACYGQGDVGEGCGMISGSIDFLPYFIS